MAGYCRGTVRRIWYRYVTLNSSSVEPNRNPLLSPVQFPSSAVIEWRLKYVSSLRTQEHPVHKYENLCIEQSGNECSWMRRPTRVDRCIFSIYTVTYFFLLFLLCVVLTVLPMS